MVNLADVKPLFYAARFFGCGPHLVTKNDILLTTAGLAYSSLWALAFLCCGFYGLYLISREVGAVAGAERKIMALTAVRTVLAYVCFFVDGVLSIRWNEKLRSALLQMRNFDVVVNYELAHPANWSVKCKCWAAVVVTGAFWVFVGYLTYKCELSNPLFNAITYVIANAAISMQLIKFTGLMLLLRQRFRYLCKLVLEEAFVAVHQTPFKTVTAAQRREFQLQDVWWLHCSLSNAADTINSVYSSQLLLWIATMWLNALSRIYAMNENLIGSSQFLLRVREALLVSVYVANLLLISVACHFTAEQANSIGKAVYMPHSALIRKRNLFENSVEIGMYFNLRQLHFSAAGGFIQIDLPLLLSIAGAITTYLMVLHNNS